MRNIAVVLSGGTGARIGMAIPKQYIELAGKPVIVYTLECLERCACVEGVIVAAAPEWRAEILRWKEKFSLTKLLGAAPAGTNRQLSIRNGLLTAEEFVDEDKLSGVIIQDAVRPLTSTELMTRLIEGLREAPAVMPALPITDTTYTSHDGQWVDGLLDRSTLFAGQAPEAFRYWPYLELYRDTPEETLCSMSGSCQLPYNRGWKVKIISGEQGNVKITYAGDLKTCEKLLTEGEKGLERICIARNW